MPHIECVFVCEFFSAKYKLFYQFNDQLLSEVLQDNFHFINQRQYIVLVNNDILNKWETNIGVLKILSDHITIFRKENQMIKATIQRPEGEQVYYAFLEPEQNLEKVILEKLNLKDDEHLYLLNKDPKNPIFKTSNKFTVFVKNLTDKTVEIVLDSNAQKIYELKLKIQEKTDTPIDVQRLIFSGEELKDGLSLADYNIPEKSTVHLVLRLRGGGCGPSVFVDISSDKGPTVHEWSQSAPDWREAHPGLCLEGYCKNEKCKAFKKMVIINKSDTTIYELNAPGTTSNCPMCNKHVEALTCAFNNCEWRFFGIKKEKNGEFKRVKCDWKISADSYHRFDPQMNGVCEWSQLAIECRKLENPTFITSECHDNTMLTKSNKNHQVN
jgi:hypothetical protein